MKKILVTLAAALLVCVCANAQFRVDVNASTTVYTVQGERSSYSLDTDLAPIVRAYTNIGGERFGVELGLGFIQRKGLDSIGSMTSKKTINSVEVPARLYFNIGLGDLLTITPLVGVYGDYAFNGSVKTNEGGNSSPFEGPDAFKRLDYGTDNELMLTFGRHFTLGLGFQYSFCNVSESELVNINAAAGYLGIGWKF